MEKSALGRGRITSGVQCAFVVGRGEVDNSPSLDVLGCGSLSATVTSADIVFFLKGLWSNSVS